MNYRTGIYQYVSGSFLGGHAVRVIGYGVLNGVNYWIAANTWGPYWGESGYFRIREG
jgi:cathepsin B